MNDAFVLFVGWLVVCVFDVLFACVFACVIVWLLASAFDGGVRLCCSLLVG